MVGFPVRTERPVFGVLQVFAGCQTPHAVRDQHDGLGARGVEDLGDRIGHGEALFGGGGLAAEDAVGVGGAVGPALAGGVTLEVDAEEVGVAVGQRGEGSTSSRVELPMEPSPLRQ